MIFINRYANFIKILHKPIIDDELQELTSKIEKSDFVVHKI